MNRIYLNRIATFYFSSKDEFLEYIKDKKKILIAINTEKILSNDQKLKKIVNDNIGYPDGIGAVIALKRKGIRAVKIPGSQIWLDIINKYHNEKTFYLIGSTNEVVNLTVKRLNYKYPKIRIKNFRDGYFNDGEFEEIKEDIKEREPDIIFVAMGCPKQEHIMAELIKFYPALYMGLGGSFDLYSGKVKPVPEWWIKLFKWEGIYRCFNNPTNLKRWERVFHAVRIVYKVLLNKI